MPARSRDCFETICMVGDQYLFSTNLRFLMDASLGRRTCFSWIGPATSPFSVFILLYGNDDRAYEMSLSGRGADRPHGQYTAGHYTAGHSFASFQPRKGRSFLRKIKNPNLRFDEVCCDSRNNLSEPAVGHGSDACNLAVMIRDKFEM